MSENSVSPTLLVIDDNINLLFSLKELLTRAQYQVITARTGQESLDTLRTQKPDLIICDVMMPPPNGFELKRILNEDSATQNIPFIFLSARAARPDMLFGLRSGADDYITKPFDPDVLLEKVRGLLRRAQAGKNSSQNGSTENALNLVAKYNEQFHAFSEIAGQIHAVDGIDKALKMTMTYLVSALEADTIELWKNNPNNGQMEHVLTFGLDGPAGMLDMDSIKPIWTTREIAQSKVRSSQFIPIRTQGRVQWSVRVCYANLQGFTVLRSPFVDALLEQLAVILDKGDTQEQLETLQRMRESNYHGLIEGLVNLLDLRHQETGFHSQRVSENTVRLAERYGLNEERLEQIRVGALAHDLGKIGIPDDILVKKGPLSDEEWRLMRRHPLYAVELLTKFGFDSFDLSIPLYHHERWNGSGYPYGLKGDEIPLEAQLFSIVDVWDAITNDRPYRKAYPKSVAREMLLAKKGIDFQPEMVDIFLEMESVMEA